MEPVIDHDKLNEVRKVCCNCRFFDGFGCSKGLKSICDEVGDCRTCFERYWFFLKPVCAHFERAKL